MLDKTEILIVEVENHPILYNKGRQRRRREERKWDGACLNGNEAPLLGDGIRHKYDATVKSGVQIYAIISSFFSCSV